MNQFGVQFQRKIGKMGKKQCGQGDECRTCQKEQKGDAFARQAAGLADFAGEAAGNVEVMVCCPTVQTAFYVCRLKPCRVRNGSRR
ncbi:TPA: hypothetical protein ACQQJ5_001400 [Neisseria gonorrhoeae]